MPLGCKSVRVNLSVGKLEKHHFHALNPQLSHSVFCRLPVGSVSLPLLLWSLSAAFHRSVTLFFYLLCSCRCKEFPGSPFPSLLTSPPT